MLARRLERLRSFLVEVVVPLLDRVRARVLGDDDRGRPTTGGGAPVASPSPDPRTESDAERLIDSVANAPTWQKRRVAAVGLGEFRGDAVVDALIRAIRDPSAEVAVAAVASLASQPDPRAEADLAEVLKETAGFIGPMTRAAAVDAIASCRGLAALPLLLETIHDGEAEVSMAAIQAAASLAPDASSEKLRAVLLDHAGYYLPIVRLTAAKALERIGGLDPGLAQVALTTESNEGVRVVLERATRGDPATTH